MKSAIQCAAAYLSGALVLLLATDCPAQSAAHGAQPAVLRVLILSGDGGHDARESTAFLRQLLQSSGRFEARVCESPAGLSAPTLAPFDVVVDDSPGASLDGDTEKALEAFVNSGRGLVVTRRGLVAPSGSSRWGKLVKAARTTSPATGADAPFHLFELKNAVTKHPVMAELKSNWRTADQPLRGLTLSAGAEVLATGDENEPLLFVSTLGKGRVFGTALGRDVGAMQEKAFITTFLRSEEHTSELQSQR